MSNDANMPVREPAIRVIAMPADTNPSGDIFGGWLMSQMDLAAGSIATRFASGRTVTIAVESMAFLQPVLVGDEVSVFAAIARLGRTSMRIDVEAWRRPRGGNESIKVTEAALTFVAIDAQGRPRVIKSADPTVV